MNPLLEAARITGEEGPSDHTPEHMEAMADIWRKAGLTNKPSSKRLAIIALKTLLKAGATENVGEVTTAASFTDDPFEAALIGLACHWGNDLIEAAFNALGVESPFQSSQHSKADAEYAAFVTLVNALEITEA